MRLFLKLFKVLLHIEVTDFPILSYTSTSRIPTRSCTGDLKRYPFRAEPPRIGSYRKYPPEFALPTFENTANSEFEAKKGIDYIIILQVLISCNERCGYGYGFRCWLSLNKGFIWSFIGPVIGIIAVRDNFRQHSSHGH